MTSTRHIVGRLRYLDSRTTFSTITVSMTEYPGFPLRRTLFPSPGPPLSPRRSRRQWT